MRLSSEDQGTQVMWQQSSSLSRRAFCCPHIFSVLEKIPQLLSQLPGALLVYVAVPEKWLWPRSVGILRDGSLNPCVEILSSAP